MPNLKNNKVELSDGTTLMDITDTTAVEEDVAEGATFYKADGTKGVGTATGGVFVAVYEQTSYADVTAAIDAHKAIVLDMPANNNQFCMTFATYTNGGNALMYAIYKVNNKPTLMTVTLTPQNQWTTSHTDLQDALVSGTNIKTINNTSLLGSGNIDVEGGVFVAEYDVTPYTDVLQAYEDGRQVIIKYNTRFWTPVVIELYTGVFVFICLTGINRALVTDPYHIRCMRFDIRGTGWTKTETTLTAELATDVTVGGIKLNPSQNITLDADGRLEVGGRIGQFEGTTGLFAPNNRAPRYVADYDLLVTDALGMNMTGNRSLGVVSGLAVTCKSAPAGSTEYRVTNNYANRILCKLAEGGFASRDEATSKVEQIVSVVSVTINGSSYTPDSAANSSNDIVIKTSETLNPSSAITSIRLFGTMGSYATIHTGNGIKSESGGRNLLLGGGVIKAGSSNDNTLVGNGIYSNGNGNAAFGRHHVLKKNRGLFAGTGHDSSNAPSEGASAVGQYSYMDANTLFAVGNGSSHTDRKNAFEVRTDGIVLRSPNGTRYKLSVDDSGNLTTTAI